MSQMRTPSSATASSATASSAAPESARSADALMAEVKALIAQGNEEQNRDFTLRLVDLASDFDIRNRRVLESVGQLQGAVRTEFGQQRQVNEQLLRQLFQSVRAVTVRAMFRQWIVGTTFVFLVGADQLRAAAARRPIRSRAASASR